ncbi:MAG: site-specific DNA-methyltransferase [Candidatus Nanohaloarchaea archaeon]
MNTEHTVHFADSRDMSEIEDGSVELTVTSPPYPMIEMWDELFTSLNSEIGRAIDDGEAYEAFDMMHDELEKVWSEVARVTCEGGVVCVNVGDATRKVDGDFQLFPNHSKVIDFFTRNGFHLLPGILWRKPTNKASKFMGSGMLPPNAYVTLEHEHILVFRKEGERRFEPGSQDRYQSAYFWEERNRWFSDVWTDVRGTLQDLSNGELRDRAAAYPFEIPYRLVNMYSVYGDTVLDPFWGTGTTSLAAMALGRNSVGFELEEEFGREFEEQVEGLEQKTREVNTARINRHEEFVEDKTQEGKDWDYEAENYGFPVMTKQEKRILFKRVDNVRQEDGGYVVEYSDFTDDDRIKEEKQQKL